MDTDLVVRAQHGDEQAFTMLADHLYGRLRRVAVKILRDEDLAKDATQQAALDMWRYLPKLRDPAKFEGWAYRLLVNRCKHEVKRARRPIPAVEAPRERGPIDTVLDRDQLERGFQRLTVDQRSVLVLHHYAGMPIEVIAETLDIPLGTVKSRMNRALRQMRLALEADHPGIATEPARPRGSR